LTDVFPIQEEISRGIVNNLRVQLGRGRRRYETSVEAYDVYLRARALTQQAPPTLFQSTRWFEESIDKDPSFAPAYAGLASVYAIRSVQFPLDHPEDELPKMRAAAEKAIALDPLLPEAHDALAMIYTRDGRWAQAETSFRHAIELDRNRSSTYDDFATGLLRVLGRNEEALQQLHVAEKADPLSALIQAHLGLVLLSARRYAEAAAVCASLPAEDLSKPQCLARARLGQGQLSEAIQLLTHDPRPNNPQTRGFLGYAYAQSGRRVDAERLAAASKYPNEQALIFAGLGDKDRTFDPLDRMAVLGPQRIGAYLNFPELALTRDDPRVQLLRQKVGLPK